MSAQQLRASGSRAECTLPSDCTVQATSPTARTGAPFTVNGWNVQALTASIIAGPRDTGPEAFALKTLPSVPISSRREHGVTVAPGAVPGSGVRCPTWDLRAAVLT